MTELTAEQWNSALSTLKRGLQEAGELIEVLKNATVIQESFDGELYFEKVSKRLLDSSFRLAANVLNGHMIKIVFDLSNTDVYQVGDHSRQQNRDREKDKEIIKNIRKTGHNDFSAKGMVKAIVDMDTKEKLQSVKTIGIIGNGSDTHRFFMPPDYKRFGLESKEWDFFDYPLKAREERAKEQNLTNASDAITFTVGKMSPVSVYQSTKLNHSTAQLFNNQWNKKARGYDPNHSNEHIKTTLTKLEKYLSLVPNKLETIKKNNQQGYEKYKTQIEEYLEDCQMLLRRIMRKSDKEVDTHFGQNKNSSFYRSTGIDETIKLLNIYLKKASEYKGESGNYAEDDLIHEELIMETYVDESIDPQFLIDWLDNILE